MNAIYNPVKFNAKGHNIGFNNRKYEIQDIIESFEIKAWKKDSEAWKNLQSFKSLVKDGVPVKEPIHLKVNSRSVLCCYYCEEHEFIVHDNIIEPANSCPHPEGLSCKVQLDIPSGRMIVGNDFRSHFDIDEKIASDLNINKAAGIIQTIKEFEKEKCLHFFVGNTSPSVYRLDNEQLKVANAGYDSKTDKELPVEGKEIAWICTDLWWVSIVDGAEADKRGMLQDADEHDLDFTEIKVTPGIYVLDYHGVKKDFDRYGKGEVIFANMELQK